MLIDTHAHVNFNAFKDDGDEVIRRALDNNVSMILVGADYKTSKRALDYANRYQSGVYAAVGLHPVHLHEGNAEGDDYNFTTHGEDFSFDIYEQLAKFEKTVAIGEVGLDYYHIDLTQDVNAIKRKQKEVFIKEVELARSFDLPVIIHCRNAHDDMLEILKTLRRERREIFPKDRPWGVMHCFSGDEDLAWEYFSLGLLISFNGMITFSKQWDDLIRKVPLDKILIETDCPYLTPEPFRGKRNEPVLVQHVAAKIAEIKSINFERIAEETTRNAKLLFRI